MRLADILIVFLLLGSIMRGIELGFVRQLFSTLGFLAGLFIGAQLQGIIIDADQSAATKAMLSLMFTLGVGVLLLSVGEYVGMVLQNKIAESQLRVLTKADQAMGSIVAGGTLLAAVWLLASILTNVPIPAMQRAVEQSRIVAGLNQTLPPAPEAIAQLGHFIDPNGFPEVFIGLEPNHNLDAPLPDAGQMQPAVEKSAAAVVRIAGRGCGGIVHGSGFIADPRLVVTNAHVVAGVDRPIIYDEKGEYRAQTIWYDPQLDMAVLQISGEFKAEPLSVISNTQASGTPGVILGYPGGGPLSASTATILESFEARGRDIYNTGYTMREIYSLKTKVDPGNSGGPLLNADGDVIGLIFAESTTHDDVGYALTMQKVIAGVEQARQKSTPVDTGSCAQ